MQLDWLCTPSLLHGSRLSAGAYTRARLSTPRLPLSESLWSFLSTGACARPLPCASSVSLVVLPVPELTRPAALHASFRPVMLACRRLRPGPPATITIANNTFLVAADSFSSARTSQERRMRSRLGGLGCRHRHWGENGREERQARWQHSKPGVQMSRSVRLNSC